jgi:hypothetical protein
MILISLHPSLTISIDTHLFDIRSPLAKETIEYGRKLLEICKKVCPVLSTFNSLAFFWLAKGFSIRSLSLIKFSDSSLCINEY